MIISDIEKEHVHDVYENIAEHFDDTRFCIWNMVKNFLSNKSATQKGIEIGCGNGKNILYRPELDIIGIDNCHNFINICKKKHIRAIHADCCYLPFETDTFDYGLSIAVFHHLDNPSRILLAVSEMIRVLKPGSECIFSVWSEENQVSKWKHLSHGDNYITWERKHDKKIFKRYYRVYNLGMVNELLNNFTHEISIKNIYNEFGNWVILFTKMN